MLDDQDPRAKALLHLIDITHKLSQPPEYIFLENVLNFEVEISPLMIRRYPAFVIFTNTFSYQSTDLPISHPSPYATRLPFLYHSRMPSQSSPIRHRQWSSQVLPHGTTTNDGIIRRTTDAVPWARCHPYSVAIWGRRGEVGTCHAWERAGAGSGWNRGTQSPRKRSIEEL